MLMIWLLCQHQLDRSKVVDNVATRALQIHAKVRTHLKAANAKYKDETNKYRCKNVCQKCDLVMAHL